MSLSASAFPVNIAATVGDMGLPPLVEEEEEEDDDIAELFIMEYGVLAASDILIPPDNIEEADEATDAITLSTEDGGGLFQADFDDSVEPGALLE